MALIAESLRNDPSIYQVQEVVNESQFQQTKLTTTIATPEVLSQSRPPESILQPEKKLSYRFVDSNQSKVPSKPKNQIPLLPTSEYYQTHSLPTREEILRQFSRLNISGDGKLTFLTLRSAFELLFDTNSSNRIDDVMVRSWLRENDLGSKGYVDINDFQRIFRSNKESSRRRDDTEEISRYRHIDTTNTTASRPTELIDSDRIARVKR